MQKIIVCLKRVVDYNVRIRVKPDGSGVVTEGLKMSINPFDEIALEEALRLREKGQAQEVVAVSIGPEDAQQWEWLLSGYISTGPRVRWRLFGSYFQIWPGFSNAEYLGFEYRSNGWANSAAGTPKTSFTVDTDTCIYPDRLMVLDLKLKYFEAKGFDTTAFYRDFLTELEAGIALDMSSANLSFAPRPGTVLIGYDNLPDSGYGLTQ